MLNSTEISLHGGEQTKHKNKGREQGVLIMRHGEASVARAVEMLECVCERAALTTSPASSLPRHPSVVDKIKSNVRVFACAASLYCGFVCTCRANPAIFMTRD